MKEPNTMNHAVNKLDMHVLQDEDRERFSHLLKTEHYLGDSPRVGDFLRQVVLRGEVGRPSCLGPSGAEA